MKKKDQRHKVIQSKINIGGQLFHKKNLQTFGLTKIQSICIWKILKNLTVILSYSNICGIQQRLFQNTESSRFIGIKI